MNRTKKSLAAVAAVVTVILASSTARADDADTTQSEPRAEHFRVGALVGAGFPRPLSVGAFANVERTYGFGIEYGFLPRTNLFGAEVGLRAVSADFRLYPFKNAFFVGLGGGRQWLDMSTSMTVGSFSGAHSVTASTWFISPRIGALHTFASGVTIGIDAGLQIPIAPETSIDSTGAAVNDADGPRAMRFAANTLGQKTTPTVDLLRIGFSF
jgi:hypothetical protein